MLKNLFSTLLLIFFVSTFTSLAPAQDGGASAGGSSSGGGDGVSLGLGIRQYTLGPGDQLDLRVYTEPQFDGPLDVNSDGMIFVPFVDEPIPAQCRSLKEVRLDVIAALRKLLRKPQVSLLIKERRSRTPAVVYGAVQIPQQFQMYRRVRLLELIGYTGGFTDEASGMIQVTHTEPTLCSEQGDPVQPTVEEETDRLQLPFEVYKINDLKLGKVDANPIIRPGDVVRVDKAYPVYVTGAVLAPQGVFLRDNNIMLTDVIARVGGVRREAKEGKIKIYRQKPDSNETETIVANYDQIRKNKQPDVTLQPYDVIEVGESGVFTSKTRLKDLVTGLAGASVSNITGAAAGNIGWRILY